MPHIAFCPVYIFNGRFKPFRTQPPLARYRFSLCLFTTQETFLQFRNAIFQAKFWKCYLLIRTVEKDY